ncbi:MAG: ABC-2 family transporter protein [Desulfobacterales bacterium]|nr:ABC-2 family transporter protein [Desulfobacterales bacterium]
MAKFWSVFKLVWIERMVYRVNFFLEILSGIVFSLIVVFLWLAIYRSAGRDLIGGYSIEQMVTYLLGGGLINTFILTTAENPETSQSIQDGTLLTLLIKPISPYAIWFVRDLGSKAFLFVLGLLGYLGVFFIFRDYLVLSTGLGHFLFFLLSLMLAALLQFFLFEALSLLAFWIENTYGIRFTMRVIMEVAGSAIIPLSFFPLIVQKVFLLLPFPFLIYLPMRIYLGKIPLGDVPLAIAKEAIWIVGLVIVNVMVWKKGIRQYVAMGD